jgi:hypothetical protein
MANSFVNPIIYPFMSKSFRVSNFYLYNKYQKMTQISVSIFISQIILFNQKLLRYEKIRKNNKS